jgi:hypothetical protein
MSSKHYWVKVWIVAAVISFLAHYAVKRYYSPAYDGNIAAYKVVSEAIESGSFVTLRDCAAKANQLASDQSLKKCSDLIYRGSDLLLQANIQTFQEQYSLSGVVKALLAGLDPVKGFKGIKICIEALLACGDFARIDAIYKPLVEEEALAIERANAESLWMAILIFIAIPLIAHCSYPCFFFKRKICRWTVFAHYDDHSRGRPSPGTIDSWMVRLNG